MAQDTQDKTQYQDFEEAQKTLQLVKENIKKVIVGQEKMIDSMLICLLAQGHLLLEGPPGTAKTLAVKAFAKSLDLKFKRIQFTPDLLPSDITGVQVFVPGKDDFSFHKGPVFCNVLLADEVNRAAAKVQSALLETMEERQVTQGSETFSLPTPFLVLATQNPIETEGTYRLPEALQDRFLMKVCIPYPHQEQELQIAKESLSLPFPLKLQEQKAVANEEDVKKMQQMFCKITAEEKVIEYATKIVRSTRPNASSKMNEKTTVSKDIQLGASPRASIDLLKVARGFAFLCGRSFVLPDDVANSASLCLCHRLVLSYEAISSNVSSLDIINQILSTTPVP